MARRAQIINISGLNPVDDPEYRYKMPTVVGKIEGKGNGIKTVISNVTDLGLSLHRAPSEVNKFFGCELGAQTTYNEETDRAVVNGAHTDRVLQDMIHRYIEFFVLCPQCKLPETEYKIKGSIIFHRCKACGAKEMVNMQHKLCTYILAQDKKVKSEKKSKDKKKDKDKEKKEKKSKDKDVDGEKKEKKKKDKKDKKDKDKKKDKKDKKDSKEEKKDETDDYIKKALTGGSKTGIVDDLVEDMDELSVDSAAGVDDAGAMDLAVASVKKFLVEHSDASVDEIAEHVVNEQMASALNSHDKVHIYVKSAFTADYYSKGEVATHAPVLIKILGGSSIMERHLIGAIEAFCAEELSCRHFPVFIKQLYDEDVLDEDVILEWAGGGRSEFTIVEEDLRAALRAEAEPVVVWLQEEDEEEEEEDEE